MPVQEGQCSWVSVPDTPLGLFGGTSVRYAHKTTPLRTDNGRDKTRACCSGYAMSGTDID
eukprot:733209-Rhodomonas_salina.4